MIREEKDTVIKGFRHRRIQWVGITIMLTVLTLALSGIMLMLGNTRYSFLTVIKVILGEHVQGASFAVGTLRLPRTLAGLLAGLAFGIAGNTFQTILRNPLASPDMIGVTSGSSVGAILCILVWKTSGNIVSMTAVLSGFIVTMSIYLLSRGSGFSGSRLILIGIGIQTMLHAIISYLLLRASQYDVPGAMRWLSGSLNGIRMKSLPALFFVVVVSGIMILILGRRLEILELGEQSAVTLGVKVNKTRFQLILCSVLLIAFATAVTGPIAFVAFLSGPIATKLAGSGKSNAIPSGMVGASLVLGADLIGQFVFETQFPVGVITGIIGAPYLLYLLIKMNQSPAV